MNNNYLIDMAFLDYQNVKIKGISAVVPKKIKKTADLPFLHQAKVRELQN